MTVHRQSRAAWTTDRNLATHQTGPRRGVAVHWPGFAFTLTGHADCLTFMARLERDTMASGRGFSAIPYNQAACVHGYLIDGRAADRRSGANGSSLSNQDYGSVVALIPTTSKGSPPRALLEALRAALEDQAPAGRLVTHRDVRPTPTDCPGPALTAWVHDGARLPAAPGQPGSSTGRRHTVKAGETLWELAEAYLGSGEQWTRIRDANRLKGPDLDVGQTLVIPDRRP